MNIKSVSNIFFALKIGTVFKKHMSEKIEEVFIQPFSNSSLAYLKNIDNNCMYETRRKTNGLIPTIFSRTVLKLNHQRTLCVNSLTGYRTWSNNRQQQASFIISDSSTYEKLFEVICDCRQRNFRLLP